MNPKVIAYTAGIASTVALLLVMQFPTRVGFFVTVGVWLILLSLLEWIDHRGGAHHSRSLPVLLLTSVSFVGLMSLIEWRILHWLLIILGGVVMYVLFRIMEAEGSLVRIRRKPYRRMMMLLWVFDAYALCTTTFAVSLFFPKIPFWFLVILSGAFFSYIAIMIWSMYYDVTLRKAWLWALIIALCMIEVVWVVHLLPFGYLAAGFLVSWVWYVLQLFVRFHFDPRGVVWKKQLPFLISNAVLYTLVLLFFVRWV